MLNTCSQLCSVKEQYSHQAPITAEKFRRFLSEEKSLIALQKHILHVPPLALSSFQAQWKGN